MKFQHFCPPPRKFPAPVTAGDCTKVACFRNKPRRATPYVTRGVPPHSTPVVPLPVVTTSVLVKKVLASLSSCYNRVVSSSCGWFPALSLDATSRSHGIPVSTPLVRARCDVSVEVLLRISFGRFPSRTVHAQFSCLFFRWPYRAPLSKYGSSVLSRCLPLRCTSDVMLPFPSPPDRRSVRRIGKICIFESCIYTGVNKAFTSFWYFLPFNIFAHPSTAYLPPRKFLSSLLCKQRCTTRSTPRDAGERGPFQKGRGANGAEVPFHKQYYR